MVLGLAVLVLSMIGLWALVVEWRFGRGTERLGLELAAGGELPVDDLPRRTLRPAGVRGGGRTFRGGTHEAGGRPRGVGALVRALPAYAAGDRRRARSAMRRAIALHDAA